MSILRNARFGVTAAVAIVALMGLAGRMDYIAEREAECAALAKPHTYDSDIDRCIPVQPSTIDNQLSEDNYYAAPSKSRKVHH